MFRKYLLVSTLVCGLMSGSMGDTLSVRPNKTSGMEWWGYAKENVPMPSKGSAKGYIPMPSNPTLQEVIDILEGNNVDADTTLGEVKDILQNSDIVDQNNVKNNLAPYLGDDKVTKAQQIIQQNNVDADTTLGEVKEILKDNVDQDNVKQILKDNVKDNLPWYQDEIQQKKNNVTPDTVKQILKNNEENLEDFAESHVPHWD